VQPSNFIIFRCDANHRIGWGHFVRCLALAEEFLLRGWEVLFLSDLQDSPWAQAQLRNRGIAFAGAAGYDPAWLAQYAAERFAAAVIIDSYEPNENFFRTLQGHAFLVMVLDDEGGRRLSVDIVLNQNFGAEKIEYQVRDDTICLQGAAYALLRDNISAAREKSTTRTFADTVARVLVIMGGADPSALTEKVVQALLDTAWPIQIRAVLGDVGRAEELGRKPLQNTQALEVLIQAADLSESLLWCDLALSAAGSTCWELACLGTPMALILTAENQKVAYEQLTAAGIALPLGPGDGLTSAGLRRALAPLVNNREARRAMGQAGAELIDGQGRRRVADEIVKRISSR